MWKAQNLHVLSSPPFFTQRPTFILWKDVDGFTVRETVNKGSYDMSMTLHKDCITSCFCLYILIKLSQWQLRSCLAKNTEDENSDLHCSGWWTNPATSATVLWLHFHQEIKVSGEQTWASSSEQQIVSVFCVQRLPVTELLLHHVSSDSGMSTWKMLNP